MKMKFAAPIVVMPVIRVYMAQRTYFLWNYMFCTTVHRFPIFSTRYFVMCKVYTGYHGTSEIEHGLCACIVDNPLAKTQGLSLRTGAQTMLYLSLVISSMENENKLSFYPEISEIDRAAFE